MNNPRAMRIAQVKFVALPMEEADCFVAPAPDYCTRGQAPAGASSFAAPFTFLRTLIIRVIGRPQAARP